MLSRNWNDFWRRFITVDETWIHHSPPETQNSPNSGFLEPNRDYRSKHLF